MKMYDNFFRCPGKLLPLLLLFSAVVQGQSYNPEQLTELSRQWLESQLQAGDKVDITALDSRLGSKDCTEPLQWKRIGSSQTVTLQLSCGAPKWQLYLSARIAQTVQAVSSRQNIAAGSVISADMLEQVETEVRLSRGSLVSDPSSIVGARVKRSLSAGQAITLQDLCLVCKGDLVTIVSTQGTLEVQTQGIAQQDAILGQQVAITNRHTQKLLLAEVIAVKKVAIKL
ncbi:flagellar basal body P-ring formation chaperone FlgA [Rheinheimera sp.]|uniref:flagellar basal body P-ring formation chaperone FlgA n=1 Tax=Rheinheimera sp. TaxID=1869214 RepID=UPI00307F62E2